MDVSLDLRQPERRCDLPRQAAGLEHRGCPADTGYFEYTKTSNCQETTLGEGTSGTFDLSSVSLGDDLSGSFDVQFGESGTLHGEFFRRREASWTSCLTEFFP